MTQHNPISTTLLLGLPPLILILDLVGILTLWYYFAGAVLLLLSTGLMSLAGWTLFSLSKSRAQMLSWGVLAGSGTLMLLFTIGSGLRQTSSTIVVGLFMLNALLWIIRIGAAIPLGCVLCAYLAFSQESTRTLHGSAATMAGALTLICFFSGEYSLSGILEAFHRYGSQLLILVFLSLGILLWLGAFAEWIQDVSNN